jgi:glycosyltransferase involved in cell wall biosynthesis
MVDEVLEKSTQTPGAAASSVGGGVCYVTAVPITVEWFLRAHIAAAAHRWPVTVVSNVDNPRWLEELRLNASLAPVAIEREIRVWRDLRALLQLCLLFRSRRFALVHSVTPKAGLLSMIAAFVARVPARIHTFTGQVWATRSGLARRGLKMMDRLMAACATHLLADSDSQRRFLIDEGIVRAGKIAVLANGSLSGVDTARFKADSATRTQVRQRLGVPADALLFVFIGRLKRDKGLLELFDAFREVAAASAESWLILVGPDEEALAPMVPQVSAASGGRVIWVGQTSAPEEYLAAADVLVLPSYREGFPTSTLEAASAGLPAIATRIYGLTDAVVDGVTGILVPPRDAAALAQAMLSLARAPDKRAALGQSARDRVRRDFSQDRVTSALMGFYARVTDRHP